MELARPLPERVTIFSLLRVLLQRQLFQILEWHLLKRLRKLTVPWVSRLLGQNALLRVVWLDRELITVGRLRHGVVF